MWNLAKITVSCAAESTGVLGGGGTYVRRLTKMKKGE